MLQPIAYLTCELKGRDLASRLLIASHLVKRGYTVVVGQQWSIFSNLRACAKGAVLFKTSNAAQGEWMIEARRNGHAVIASDEECMAVPPGPHTLVLTHATAAESCHVYLAVHEGHAATIRDAYPNAAHKVRVAGSARIDLLRAARPPRPLAEPYILLNTSFGVINHLIGDVKKGIEVWIGSAGYERNADVQQMVNERVSFEERSLAETFTLIDWLLANTSMRIVLRPHPAERSQLWSDRYGHDGRILLALGTDPLPWMKHAVLVVHNESTTGVEAALMGVKALNVSPPSPWRERVIVHRVNVTVPSAAEATVAIADLLAKGGWPAPGVDADALFPKDGARKFADAIAGVLPDPRSASGSFTWHKITRTEMQAGKFSVTLAEVTSQVTCKVAEVDDSVFVLMP